MKDINIRQLTLGYIITDNGQEFAKETFKSLIEALEGLFGEPPEGSNVLAPRELEKIKKDFNLTDMGAEDPAPIVVHTPRRVDFMIPPFDYDKNKLIDHKNVKIFVAPDGRIMVQYREAHYYTTRSLMDQIPIPFKQSFFSKENGWHSTVENAIKRLKEFLMLPENDPDRPYRKMLHTDTRATTGQEYEKVE